MQGPGRDDSELVQGAGGTADAGGGGGGMCDAKSLLGAQMAGGMIPRADAGYKVAVAPGRWQGRDAEVVQGGRDRWHN